MIFDFIRDKNNTVRIWIRKKNKYVKADDISIYAERQRYVCIRRLIKSNGIFIDVL